MVLDHCSAPRLVSIHHKSGVIDRPFDTIHNVRLLLSTDQRLQVGAGPAMRMVLYTTR